MSPRTPGALVPRFPRRLAAAAALAALAWLVFSPLGDAGFVSFDDPGYVSEERHIRGGPTAENLLWALTAFHQSNWHPLTLVSHMVDVRLFGADPRGHHLVNVALHAANAALLFLLLRSLTGAALPALTVAALFAFHPLHVESVAWVAERKDVLSTFFWFLGIAAYLRHLRRPRAGGPLLAALCLAAGLMAKPMLVTFPLTLLVLDYWPLGRFRRPGPPSPADAASPLPRRLPGLLAEKLPLFGLCLGAAILTYLAQLGAGSVKDLALFTLGDRVANVAAAPVFYLQKTIAPLGLTVFYPFSDSPSWGRAALSLLLLLSGTAVAAAQSRRRPYLAAGWAWFLITLLPVLGLIQVGHQAAADRYTYVPLVGVFAAASWLSFDLLARRRGGAILLGALWVTLVAGCVVLTGRQLPVWRDSLSLFGHALAVNPGNWLAHNGYALALAERGRWEEAERHYRESIRLNPAFPVPRVNLGNLLAQRGELDEAIGHYRTALSLDPRRAAAHYNLGNAYRRAGRGREAEDAYRAAVALAPDLVEARNNLAHLLAGRNELGEALAHLRAAEAVDPGFPLTLSNLGLVLRLQGNLPEAQRYLRRGVTRP